MPPHIKPQVSIRAPFRRLERITLTLHTRPKRTQAPIHISIRTVATSPRMNPTTKIHINPYPKEEYWQYQWRPTSDQPPENRRQHHTHTKLMRHTRHRTAYKTGQHISTRIYDREDNTTIAHHHPQTAMQTRQHSYHSYTFSESFHNKNQYKHHAYSKHDQKTKNVTRVARQFAKHRSRHYKKQHGNDTYSNNHTTHYSNTTFTTPTIVLSMSNVALSIFTSTRTPTYIFLT